MDTVRAKADVYVLDDAVDTLFSMLDEAIDDMENGRVISEKEMWSDLEEI